MLYPWWLRLVGVPGVGSSDPFSRCPCPDLTRNTAYTQNALYDNIVHQCSGSEIIDYGSGSGSSNWRSGITDPHPQIENQEFWTLIRSRILPWAGAGEKKFFCEDTDWLKSSFYRFVKYCVCNGDEFAYLLITVLKMFLSWWCKRGGYGSGSEYGSWSLRRN
jgi:hypothetical protein